MVLLFTAFGTEQSQLALTSKLFIICSCLNQGRAAPASSISSQKKTFKNIMFLGSTI